MKPTAPTRQPGVSRVTSGTRPRPAGLSTAYVARGLELVLACVLATTVSYFLVFFLRLPAFFLYPVLVGAVALSCYLTVRKSRTFARPLGTVHWSNKVLLAICLVSATVSVFYGRPDADDVDYYHRALYQLKHLSEPFSRTDIVHGVPGLQYGSPFHMTTMIEPVTALIAHATGIPPLQMLHNIVGSISLFLLPLVYFSLLRFFKFTPSQALFGTVATLGFLAMSGDSHRDWGNFTIMRSWQGKCILVALLLPATYLHLTRWLLAGRGRDLVILHAIGLTGIGLSGTAMFLLPWTGGLIAVGFLLAGGSKPKHWRRIIIAATPLIYPAIFSLLQVSGILPGLADTTVWRTGWPETPAGTLAMVFPDNQGLLLAAGLLVLAAITAPVRFQGRALLIAGAVGFAVPLIPFAYSLLVKILTPAVVWRLLYAIPLPLAAGVAAAGALRLAVTRADLKGRLAGAILLCAIVAITTLVKDPAVTSVWLKAPSALKFRRPDIEAARQLAARIPAEATVLGPERLVIVLALVEPSLKFVALRIGSTHHAFNNAGRADEARLRIGLQRWISTCNRDAATAPVFQSFVAERVNAVITFNCGPRVNEQMLSILNGAKNNTRRWAMETLVNYILFTPTGPPSPESRTPLPFGLAP